jgi:hypothetical protein
MDIHLFKSESAAVTELKYVRQTVAVKISYPFRVSYFKLQIVTTKDKPLYELLGYQSQRRCANRKCYNGPVGIVHTNSFFTMQHTRPMSHHAWFV